MGIHIKSGYYEYTIPINPQSYALNPQPRYTIDKTIGGRFIQLLGAHYEGAISGLLTTTNKSLDEQWATQHLFETFMTHVYENQKNGVPSYLTIKELNLTHAEVAFKDYQITDQVGQVGYTYSLSFILLKQPELTSTTGMNNLFSHLLNQIGWDEGSAWHGGNGTQAISLNVKAVNGFSNMGPTTGSNSGSSAPNVSSANGKANMTPSEAQAYAKSILPKYGFTADQFHDLILLWDRESSWRMNADNPTSHAYGISQLLGKHSGYGIQGLPSTLTEWNQAFRDNAMLQIQWGLEYIKHRYGSITAAWEHEITDGWY